MNYAQRPLVFFTALLGVLATNACASDAPDAVDAKAKVAAAIAAGAPSDSAFDPCAANGWYGDGECDGFCPLEDELDCDGTSFCAAALCGPDTVCDEALRACLPVSRACASSSDCDAGETCLDGVCDPGDFCTRALCGPGFECDEARDTCVPAGEADFCLRVLCSPDSVCDEELDACVPLETEAYFCLRATCGPGTVCDEDLDACVPIDDDFCTRALCAPDYRCDEDLDACVPVEAEPDFCLRATCGPGTVCDEARDACVTVSCSDHCGFANDGECDDGGPGSDYALCPLGSDCSDCGSR